MVARARRRHATQRAGVALTVAALLALALLVASDARAQACEPDATRYTPTPVFEWDGVPDIDLAGYRVYVAIPGGVWTLGEQIPCEMVLDEDIGATFKVCRTRTVPQRYRDDEATLLDLCVVAYDSTGRESETCTVADADPLSGPAPEPLCFPEVWHHGEVYR